LSETGAFRKYGGVASKNVNKEEGRKDLNQNLHDGAVQRLSLSPIAF